MVPIENVSAVIFDMDGTLVDSEIFTKRSVISFCHEHGINHTEFDYSQFDGLSWNNIAKRMVDRFPQLDGDRDIPNRLHETYHQLLKNEPLPVIRGARETVVAASALMPTAIVSSSHRESVEETIRRMDISAFVDYYAGSEDCVQNKPAPDGYLNAAEFLETEAAECLVFEDSITGITAARRAGMFVIAVSQDDKFADQISKLVHLVIHDYADLDDRFFEQVRKQD